MTETTPGTTISWLSSLAEAEARVHDELILVDFSAAPG